MIIFIFFVGLVISIIICSCLLICPSISLCSCMCLSRRIGWCHLPVSFSFSLGSCLILGCVFGVDGMVGRVGRRLTVTFFVLGIKVSLSLVSILLIGLQRTFSEFLQGFS